MANTFTQIHIQVVFTVRDRECVISREWKDELFRYITGIVQNNGHKLLVINGMPDHIHIMFGQRPKQSLSELMQDIKGSSSKWINERKLLKGRFSWQEGYGAFSYSYRDVPGIIDYILKQEEHHRGRSFLTEYYSLLKENEIDYDDKYVFNPVPVEYQVWG